MVLRGGDEPKLVQANSGLLIRCDFGGDASARVRLADGPEVVATIEWSSPSTGASVEIGPWLSRGLLDFATAPLVKAAAAKPFGEASFHELGHLLGLRYFLNLGPTDYALPDQIDSASPTVIWIPSRPDESDPDAAMMRSMGLPPDLFD